MFMNGFKVMLGVVAALVFLFCLPLIVGTLGIAGLVWHFTPRNTAPATVVSTNTPNGYRPHPGIEVPQTRSGTEMSTLPDKAEERPMHWEAEISCKSAEPDHVWNDGQQHPELKGVIVILSHRSIDGEKQGKWTLPPSQFEYACRDGRLGWREK